jgi:hypothetical protein
MGLKGWESIISGTASDQGSLAYIHTNVSDDELVSAFAYVMRYRGQLIDLHSLFMGSFTVYATLGFVVKVCS